MSEKFAPLMVSVKQAARLMSVSEWTIRRMVRSGTLPSTQFQRNGAIRIPYRALERIVKEAMR